MEYLYSFLIVVGIIIGAFVAIGIVISGLLFVSDWFENRFEDFPVWLQIILQTIKWTVVVFAIGAFIFLITMTVHAQMFA